jgi:lysophospholipase L1-like esterase
MQRPWHSLLFGLLFFLALAILAILVPKDGIALGPNFTIKFPSLTALFQTHQPKKDISKILLAADEAEEELPEIKNSDTAVDLRDKKNAPRRLVRRDTIVNLITSIQVKDQSALANFFNALLSLESNPDQQIRVLHYGDSQIEGDRITDYLRQKLQGEFGGSGPGLISLMPVSSSLINRLILTGIWDRYTAGTGKDKRVQHKAFGPMIGFARYLPYKKLSDTSSTQTATVLVNTTKAGGAEVMNYQKIKLFYGGSKRKTWCEYYDGPALLAADSLQAGGILNVKEFKAGNGSYAHKLKFRGKDSPDFYGLSLESNSGILIDNIALRGSSGTFFHQVDANQLRLFYEYLNVKLIILEFGGNALPFITNDTLAKSYASWMRGQIAIVKRLAPSASILFVGPADMAVKDGTDYITHPYLELMRDELKKVVLDSHCAYFDMYDCMGGRNSMSSWVDEKLAAADYIHFSPKGARKVSALLHAALINAYKDYTEKKN